MMNSRLQEAALTGSVDLLHRLAREDPALLDQPPAAAPDTTPLHVAALYGHAEFARAALALKPDLSRRRDPTGSLPLHLAAARANVEIVRELAQADPGACLERDEQGHTPLHVAAMRGRAGALTEMVRANPGAVRALTEGGETALHICAKNNQLDALKLLVEGLGGGDGDVEFLNKGDGDGNTALHLSVEKRHVQIVKYLVSTKKMEINALNNKGQTALDSVESGWIEFADAAVEAILVGAGAERRGTLIDNQSGPLVENLDIKLEVPAINDRVLIEGTSHSTSLASSSASAKLNQGEQAAVVTTVVAERTERLSTQRCNTNKQATTKFFIKKGVYKIDLHDNKEKTRVMKVVSGINGVDCISLSAKDNLLTIIGEVDFVEVTARLRKKFHVELVSVEELRKEDHKKGQGNVEKKRDTNAQIPEFVAAYNACSPYKTAPYYVYSVEENPNACAIS